MGRMPSRSTGGGGVRRSARLAAKSGGASASTLASAPSPSPSPSPLRQAPSPGSRQAASPTPSPESRQPDSPMDAAGAESPASLIKSSKVAQVDLQRIIVLMGKLLNATRKKYDAMLLYESGKGKFILEEYKLSQAQKMLENEEGILKSNENQTITLKELEAQIDKARINCNESKEQRKALHDKLLDLKGTVRVFLRICPLKAKPGEAFTIDDNDPHVIKVDSINKSIMFDKIFNVESKQADIFEEISPLVQSALDGNKVCVFAYGQTGSGKTHTTIGVSDVSHESAGILPRTVKFILDSGKKVKVSVIEVYNNKLRDLLSSGGCDQELQIRRDKDDVPFVTNLESTDVTSTEDFRFLIDQIVSRRFIGETKLNSKSSRSHCIFQFAICDAYGKDVGGIAITDLAGCEYLKETEATGDRKKEAQEISKSLSLLRRILTSIARKDTERLPFRDLKLTHILERYLRSGTKVVMIATIAQEDTAVTHNFYS